MIQPTRLAAALAQAGLRLPALQHRAIHMSLRVFWQARSHTHYGLPRTLA